MNNLEMYNQSIQVQVRLGSPLKLQVQVQVQVQAGKTATVRLNGLAGPLSSGVSQIDFRRQKSSWSKNSKIPMPNGLSLNILIFRRRCNHTSARSQIRNNARSTDIRKRIPRVLRYRSDCWVIAGGELSEHWFVRFCFCIILMYGGGREELGWWLYVKIALQFPDELLHDSVPISLILKRELEGSCEVYIMADTSYGRCAVLLLYIINYGAVKKWHINSCCVDEVAASHVDADVIVHYGHACMSQWVKCINPHCDPTRIKKSLGHRVYLSYMCLVTITSMKTPASPLWRNIYLIYQTSSLRDWFWDTMCDIGGRLVRRGDMRFSKNELQISFQPV